MRAAWAILALGLLAACLPAGDPGPDAAGSNQCRPERAFEAAPLNPCAAGPQLRLTVVGDVLLHWQLQQMGYAHGFAQFWSQAAPWLAAADVAIANVEGPVAPGLAANGRAQADPGPVYGTGVYTGYPRFNYHPVILKALRAAGVDVITTANNHAMDRGPAGADLTLQQARAAGLVPVGTIARGAARDFAVRYPTRAGSLSLIACSFSTNGIADPARQVLRCYDDRDELLALVRREARDPAVAAVLVLPHWGQEYRSAPDARQRALARDLAGAGATAIIGTHPHAVQPFATLQGAGRTVPVAWSTGNFIAVQTGMPSRVGALALLDLCPAPGGGLVAENFGWIAAEMTFAPRRWFLSVAPRGAEGPAGLAERHLQAIAPGYSAQPACSPAR